MERLTQLLPPLPERPMTSTEVGEREAEWLKRMTAARPEDPTSYAQITAIYDKMVKLGLGVASREDAEK